MRKRLLPTLLISVIIGLAWAAELNAAFSTQLSPETGNYESTYSFSVQNGYYLSAHTLYASLPPSLKTYYQGKTHAISSEIDYAKFVTPNAVQSIAENIRNVTRNTPYDDEEFANAVLMIVHEIPYLRSNAKYPVETLVDNSADCDGLSILAASMLKAGGLDVVLLLYKGMNPTHMNVGVYLDHRPIAHSWWATPSGIDYDNKTYWIAECTSLADWTVGNRPEILVNDKPIVIPLQNCEKKSPASISSSLKTPLQPSSISIALSPSYYSMSGDERALNISGSVFPATPDEHVAVYINQPGYSPAAYTTSTDQFGNYTLTWNVTTSGTYKVKTSWSGSANYSGSDSETLTVYIGAQQPPIRELPDYFWNGGSSDVQSWAYSPEYLAMLSQGSKAFLNSSLVGKDVVLSGEFIVLSNGQDEPPNETTITIPAYKRIIVLPRNRRPVTVEVPEQTMTIPMLQNQFGFILKRTAEENYTASVQLLSDNDVSQIAQSLNQSGSMFMNASTVATKNMWHKAIAKVNGDELTVEICDDNGTRLENMAKTTTETGVGELGILMGYVPGQVLAFKNLKIETLEQNPLPVAEDQVNGNGIDFLYPYIRMLLLLAGAALAVVILKGRKKNNVNTNNLLSPLKRD